MAKIFVIDDYELKELYDNIDEDEGFNWKRWNRLKVKFYYLIREYVSLVEQDDKRLESFRIETEAYANLIECRKDVCQARKDKHSRRVVDCWKSCFPDLDEDKLKKKIKDIKSRKKRIL